MAFLTQFAARPGLLVALGLALGLGMRAGGGLALAGLAALLALGVGLRAPKDARGAPSALGVASAFFLGLYLAPPPTAPQPGLLVGEATTVGVASPSRYGSGWDVDARTSRGLVRLTNVGFEPAWGETLKVSGEVRPFSPRQAAIYARRGFIGRLRPRASESVRPAPTWARAFRAVRQSFRASVRAGLPPRQAAFVEALAANLVADLDDAQEQALRDSGTVHLVSASGYHAGVLLGFVVMGLSFLPAPRGVRLALGIAIVGAYAVAVGLQAPIVRAATMAAILLFAPFFGRRPDALSALGWSAFVWLVGHPADLLDVSFALSYVTLAALVIGGGREGTAAWLGRTGVWAVVGSAPLVAYTFGRVSTYGLVANVGLELVVPLILAFVAAGWLLSLVWWGGGIWLIGCVGWLVRGIENGLAMVASWPGSVIEVAPFSGWWLWPLAIGGLALWRPRRRSAPVDAPEP